MKWLVLILLVASCHQAEFIPNNCGVNNPLQDLTWLKKLNRDDGTGSSIVQGTHQGQTVYAVYRCARYINGSNLALYHCDGSIFCNGLALDQSTSSCSQIVDNLSDRRTLVEYKP
ncbi:hypothetical protein SAMN05216167_13533 [Spirosoma endophyticum]|uniref:Uncharacterized protein n=1 Tax=Spirosoma endophyticum TaxID=662367 RepID=A0A1I2GU82_9BACT|nr:hypothetical protein SAMN05216167_13533 [Spirosoma endophyticum]